MIKNIKSKLLSSIKNKRINVFILFLMISFGILLLTKLSKSYTNTIGFEINKINVPEEHVVFNSEGKQLNVSIKTQGFNLLKYYFKKPLINIYFDENITKTDSFYVWNSSLAYSNIIAQFDKDVEVLNINPDTLTFRYDVNSIKKVPIVLNTQLKFSQGYDLLEQFKVEPDSIKIIGPETLVEKINSIQTDTLILTDISKDVISNLSLQLPKESNELKFSDKQILVTASIGKFTEGNLKIPIHVKNVPENIAIKYFPKKVNVSYYTSLKNFNTIRVEDFVVECDFLEVSDNQPFLMPKVIKKPNNVRNIKMNQVQIDYIITE